MTACGHRVRFAATWREEFFEVPLRLSVADAAVLVVVMRKRFLAEFKVPFQMVYERDQVSENAARYEFVVDGDVLSGQRIAYLTRGDLPKPE
jgi:hypothetical protein